MHENNPFQNIKDYHRQNLNELGDTFKGKLKLAGYAARRFGKLKGLEGQEKKIQKEKQGVMDLIRSGNAPPLSHVNKLTDIEYALHNRGNRMARGIRSAIRSIAGRPITESAEKHLADFAGYAVYKDGKWYQSEGDVKKGKGISSDELWNRHGDEYKRHLDLRKGANEDIDSRNGESRRFEELFHKDSDRLLREHIRAEYEARGIYPTSREVQETYNHIVDLLEKTRASERDAILAKQHGTSGTANGMMRTKQELRRQRAGNSPQDYGDPMRTSKEEGQRQGKHTSARGNETNISPSSPARQQSKVEKHTRKHIARSRRGNRSRGIRWFARNRGNDDTESLLKQGFSRSYLEAIISGTGR